MSELQLAVLASGAAADAISRHVPDLVKDRFASRLFAEDPTLWGPEAESESAIRLSWVGLPHSSRPLVAEIDRLREELRGKGLDHVVLCGMGGSSLAPEVIVASSGVELTVLDSSQPDYVRAALADRLDSTIVVVSSKSGSTVETDSQKRVYEAAFKDAGIDPTERIVIVTDPGSPMDEAARAAGYRVFNADPDVGGRYSALTAFGLVPSGLAGVDVGALLAEAESVAGVLAADDEGNPALRLGAALAGTQPLRDKILLVDAGTPIVGFGDWAEQLIAESTGKQGKGLLPVVVPSPGPSRPVADATVVRLVAGSSEDEGTSPSSPAGDGSAVEAGGSLGAQLLLWEVAVAAAGRLLGINPFDQPDVESAKKASRGLLEQSGSTKDPAVFTDGAIEVRTLGGDWLADAATIPDAVSALLAQLDTEHGYVAVMAYLDRLHDASLAEAAGVLADRVHRPVTFGWGPRFLHSTGQYHKGGPATGVYLQVTSAPLADLAIPGRDFTFGEFIASQAAGDSQVLGGRGRPVLRLHLTEHDAGMAQLRSALGLDGGSA